MTINRSRLAEIALGTDHDDGANLNELIEAVADLLDERDRLREWATGGVESIIFENDGDKDYRLGYRAAAIEVDGIFNVTHGREE